MQRRSSNVEDGCRARQGRAREATGQTRAQRPAEFFASRQRQHRNASTASDENGGQGWDRRRQRRDEGRNAFYRGQCGEQWENISQVRMETSAPGWRCTRRNTTLEQNRYEGLANLVCGTDQQSGRPTGSPRCHRSPSPLPPQRIVSRFEKTTRALLTINCVMVNGRTPKILGRRRGIGVNDPWSGGTDNPTRLLDM